MSKAEENLDTTPAHSQAGGLRPEHFQQRTFVMIIFDGFEYPVLAGWSLLSQRCDVIEGVLNLQKWVHSVSGGGDTGRTYFT